MNDNLINSSPRKAFNMFLLLIVVIGLLTFFSCKKEEVKRPAILELEAFEPNTPYKAIYSTFLSIAGNGEYELFINNKSYKKETLNYQEIFIPYGIINEKDIYEVKVSEHSISYSVFTLKRIEQY